MGTSTEVGNENGLFSAYGSFSTALRTKAPTGVVDEVNG